MTALEFHPLADIFPLLEGQDFTELAADIKAHGLHEPIVLFEGRILDGRNRFRACLAAGVEPMFRPFDGDDPLAYVISLNLKRRHLSESQRAMVAAKLATLKRGDNQHSPIGETSQAKAAELLNVGKRSVERATEVRDHGAPELQRAVERGDVSVSAAADVAALPEDEQRGIVARGEREILRAAQQIRARKAEVRRAERIERLAATCNQNTPFPRGDMPSPSPANRPCSVIDAPRREHSRKPDEGYELVEAMYPELPRLELFARNTRPGWAAWGNEAPDLLNMAIKDVKRAIGK
jgi:ParB-like chromosome segregation protein Spo0J